jgi:hypothetical protein
MKNLRVVTAETQAAPPPPLSPARGKLRDLLDQVAMHEKRIAEHRAAADRLDDMISAPTTARAALVEFDAQSAAAAAEWAKASLKPNAPTVDAKRRLELLSDVATAQENAAAAVSAQKQFTDQIHAEAKAVEALKAQIAHAVAEIIAERASGQLIDDLRAAQYEVAVIRSKLEQALQTVFAIAHSGPIEAMKPTFNLAANLAEVFRTTAPAGLEVGAGFADRQAWETFATDLRTDPGAELKG